MKISNRTNKALSLLDNKDRLRFEAFEEDEIAVNMLIDSQVLKTAWRLYVDDFSRKIYFISESFHLAARKALKRIMPIVADLYASKNEDYELSGTYSFNGFTYFAYLKSNRDKDDIDRFLLMFTNSGLFMGFLIDSNKLSETTAYCYVCKSLRVQIGIEDNDWQKMRDFLETKLDQIAMYSVFKDYAEVEIETVCRKSVKKSKAKIVNETDYDIQYLDSTWFKTLVRTEGFRVSGHFRLQPFGKELKDRKLIWVSDFQKSGYTKTAKKENL